MDDAPERPLGRGAPPRDTAVETVARSVWAETLPSVPFDADTAWRDLGLDSLKALTFVLRLERSLGRKIGFAGFSASSSVGDLLRLIDRGVAPPAGLADGRPHVFYMPGLLGDDPTQARFRHALRREVRFTTLEPARETPGRVLVDIPSRAKRLTDAVLAMQPSGDVHLAGCSFGALVAQEMATQLEARGRRVASLVLLDGFLTPQTRHDEQWKLAVGMLVEPTLHALRLLDAAGWLLRRPWLQRFPWAHRQQTRVTRGWGLLAVRRWRPRLCAAHALLVTSDDFDRLSSVAGWRRVCPSIEVTAVPGNHFEIFDPPAMSLIHIAVLSCLNRAPASA